MSEAKVSFREEIKNFNEGLSAADGDSLEDEDEDLDEEDLDEEEEEEDDEEKEEEY